MAKQPDGHPPRRRFQICPGKVRPGVAENLRLEPDQADYHVNGSSDQDCEQIDLRKVQRRQHVSSLEKIWAYPTVD
jgi:hypothetical protein